MIADCFKVSRKKSSPEKKTGWFGSIFSSGKVESSKEKAANTKIKGIFVGMA